MRMQNRVLSDDNAFPDNGKSPDPGASSQTGARIHDRGGVNPRPGARPLVEQLQRARKAEVRILHEKDLAAAGILAFCEDDRPRGTCREEPSIARIRHEADLVRLSAFNRRCGADLSIGISAELSTDRLGDFAQFPFSAFGHAPV